MKVRYKEVNKVLLNPNVDESEKRSIDDIVPKAAKIARTKLENQI